MHLLPKKIRKRFVVKIIIIYTLLLCLSITFIYSTLIRNFIHRLEEKQLSAQQDILNLIQLNANEEYSKIIDIVIKMHNTKYEGKTVSEIIEQGLYNESQSAQGRDYRIHTFLANTSNYSQGIIDIILIKASNGLSFYGTNMPNRSVISGYDFYNNIVLKNPEHFKNDIQFNASHKQNYIIPAANKSLISVTGKLINIIHLNNTSDVGYYIINIDPEIFIRSNRYKINDLKGYIFMYDQDNNILYNNSPYLSNQLTELAGRNTSSIQLDKTYLLNKVIIKKAKWTICHIFPQDSLAKETKSLYVRVIKYIIITITLLMFIILWISRYYSKRMKSLMGVIKSVEDGNLHVDYTDYGEDEIGQLSQAFNKMCVHLDEHIKKEYILEIERKNATIEALQNTINPHFLYNTLEAIRTRSLMNHDYDTSEMITLLGNIFRWSIQSNDVMVRLEDEIEYAMCFLSLQNMRYENAITIDCKVDDNILKYSIPKFTLQPLVENAIVHGIKDNLEESMITIKATKENSFILLSVSDNGCGIKYEDLQNLIDYLNVRVPINNEHIGLRNVHQRLKLIYGESNGLTIISHYQQGTKVQIKIPCTIHNGDDFNVKNTTSG